MKNEFYELVLNHRDLVGPISPSFHVTGYITPFIAASIEEKKILLTEMFNKLMEAVNNGEI